MEPSIPELTLSTMAINAGSNTTSSLRLALIQSRSRCTSPERRG